MAKKPVVPPMATQPLSDGQNQPIPMGPSSAGTPRKNSSKTLKMRSTRAAIVDGKAEIVRRGSLKKQRSQLEAIRKRKGRS
ncbi:MAG: hypothetical protein WCB02_15400 [Bradyrhizobium sp.]